MTTTKSKRGLSIGALLFGVIALLGGGQAVLDNEADAKARTVRAPRFEVDPPVAQAPAQPLAPGNDDRRMG